MEFKGSIFWRMRNLRILGYFQVFWKSKLLKIAFLENKLFPKSSFCEKIAVLKRNLFWRFRFVEKVAAFKNLMLHRITCFKNVALLQMSLFCLNWTGSFCESVDDYSEKKNCWEEMTDLKIWLFQKSNSSEKCYSGKVF